MCTKAIAFTGLRPESLPFGENELSSACIRLKTMLLTEIMDNVAVGYNTFLVGGARGGDIIFAEQVLLVKATEYPGIRLISVVPHEGQANNWSAAWRDRYFRVMELSTDVITLSAKYSSDCYHIRNRYLVDNADKLLALHDSSTAGGTAYTIAYAHRQNKEIIVINPITLERTVIPPRVQPI